jgi:hypothetical protein
MSIVNAKRKSTAAEEKSKKRAKEEWDPPDDEEIKEQMCWIQDICESAVPMLSTVMAFEVGAEPGMNELKQRGCDFLFKFHWKDVGGCPKTVHFYCNKALLILASQYFRTMMEASFKEKDAECTDVKFDSHLVSANAFYCFLCHVYGRYMFDLREQGFSLDRFRESREIECLFCEGTEMGVTAAIGVATIAGVWNHTWLVIHAQGVIKRTLSQIEKGTFVMPLSAVCRYLYYAYVIGSIIDYAHLRDEDLPNVTNRAIVFLILMGWARCSCLKYHVKLHEAAASAFLTDVTNRYWDQWYRSDGTGKLLAPKWINEFYDGSADGFVPALGFTMREMENFTGRTMSCEGVLHSGSLNFDRHGDSGHICSDVEERYAGSGFFSAARKDSTSRLRVVAHDITAKRVFDREYLFDMWNGDVKCSFQVSHPTVIMEETEVDDVSKVDVSVVLSGFISMRNRIKCRFGVIGTCYRYGTYEVSTSVGIPECNAENYSSSQRNALVLKLNQVNTIESDESFSLSTCLTMPAELFALNQHGAVEKHPHTINLFWMEVFCDLLPTHLSWEKNEMERRERVEDSAKLLSQAAAAILAERTAGESENEAGGSGEESSSSDGDEPQDPHAGVLDRLTREEVDMMF